MRGSEIDLMFYSTWSIVKITMGSIIFGSAHPISFGEKANAFSRCSNISRNQVTSSGSRNFLTLIRSCFTDSSIDSSVNVCPISMDFRSSGCSDTSFFLLKIFVGNGPAVGLTFLSTVLYFVETIFHESMNIVLHLDSNPGPCDI